MAFATNELQFVDLSGFTPNLSLLVGRYTSDGGSTGGVITPGTPSAGSAAGNSVGMRNIIGNGYFTTETASGNSIKSVKSYSAGSDRDILTITTPANDVGIYFILGYQNGA